MLDSFHYITIDNTEYLINLWKYKGDEEFKEYSIHVSVKDYKGFFGEYSFIFKCTLKDFQKKLLKYHQNKLRELESK